MVNARHAPSSSDDDRLTRRQALGRAGEGLVGLAALAQLSGGGARIAAGAPTLDPAAPASNSSRDARPAEKLKLATCQFPVSGKIVENAKYIRDFLHQAADAGVHLLHTSEGGWYHNFQPLKLREDEIMTWGTPSKHPRQIDGQAEP